MSENSERLVLASAPTARVRVLTLNRPGKRNALSKGLIVELLAELQKASADPDVKAIVITGGSSFFSGNGHHLKKHTHPPISVFLVPIVS